MKGKEVFKAEKKMVARSLEYFWDVGELEDGGLGATLFVGAAQRAKLGVVRLAGLVPSGDLLASQRVRRVLVKVEGARRVAHEQLAAAVAQQLV